MRGSAGWEYGRCRGRLWLWSTISFGSHIVIVVEPLVVVCVPVVQWEMRRGLGAVVDALDEDGCCQLRPERWQLTEVPTQGHDARHLELERVMAHKVVGGSGVSFLTLFEAYLNASPKSHPASVEERKP